MRGESVTVKEIMQNYLQNKKRIAILETEKMYLDKLDFTRVTSYEDNRNGPGIGVDGRYCKNIDHKEEIELEINMLRAEVAKVDKVMELIEIDYEIECQAFKLRHLHHKTLDYMQVELGYCRNSIIKKIKFAESEFQKMMA